MKNFYFIIASIIFLIACFEDEPLDFQVNSYCNVESPKHDTVVLLVLGQSNAANAGKGLYYFDCDKATNFYKGQFYPIKDPLYGANGNGGSVWSRLAQLLIVHNFANHIIIAPCAIGGSAIEQWTPGGDLHYLLEETITALQQSQLNVTHVLWHQGESNNIALNPNLTPQENAQFYKDQFLILSNYLRANNINSPIFLAQTSRCASMESDYDLLQAQQDLAIDSLNIFNGPNTDIIGNEYRYDDCHFNSKGLEKHAQLWSDILLAF